MNIKEEDLFSYQRLLKERLKHGSMYLVALLSLIPRAFIRTLVLIVPKILIFTIFLKGLLPEVATEIGVTESSIPTVEMALLMIILWDLASGTIHSIRYVDETKRGLEADKTRKIFWISLAIGIPIGLFAYVALFWIKSMMI